MRKKNLVLNQKFGDLTVNSAPSEVNGEIVYYCKCSCGNNLSVREVDLKSGNVSWLLMVKPQPLVLLNALGMGI